MKEKITPVLTVILLLFAVVTLAVQGVKEFRSVAPITLPNGLNIVCTHATSRCLTCRTIEILTKELLDEHFMNVVKTGRIVFRDLNYEALEAAEFAGEYKVATASVVLVDVQNGKTVAGVNLANEAWKLHTDPPEFKKMLKEQIEAMLQGKIMEIDDSSEEIDLGGEEIDISL